MTQALLIELDRAPCICSAPKLTVEWEPGVDMMVLVYCTNCRKGVRLRAIELQVKICWPR